MSWWSDSGCPMRWTVPSADILPSNYSGWGFPIGNQSWFQEGQNGMAELPAVRRWGMKPHCFPAHQCTSRKILVWQGQLILFTHRHDPHAATDGGNEPEELVCCPRSDLFPRGNSRNIPFRECISPPSPSLWFSFILWMYHDYLPLFLLWGCHVASCILGILQRTP